MSGRKIATNNTDRERIWKWKSIKANDEGRITTALSCVVLPILIQLLVRQNWSSRFIPRLHVTPDERIQFKIHSPAFHK